jgi:hypothetical protein
MLVPLQAWELIHLSTYHRKLLSFYAKLRQDKNTRRVTKMKFVSACFHEITSWFCISFLKHSS